MCDPIGETNSHALLASRGLAPALLARFQNGLLYRFIRGHPTSHLELAHAPIWRGVARRLGQWHAVLPINGKSAFQPTTTKELPAAKNLVDATVSQHPDQSEAELSLFQTRHPGPSLWTVLQKWILVLPTATEEQRARRFSLQKELDRVVKELDDGKGIGEDGVRRAWPGPLIIITLPINHYLAGLCPLRPAVRQRDRTAPNGRIERVSVRQRCQNSPFYRL